MASFRVMGVIDEVKKATIVKDEPYYTTSSAAITKSFSFTFESSKTYIVEAYANTVRTNFSCTYSGSTGEKIILKNTMTNAGDAVKYMQYIDVVKGCSDTLTVSFSKTSTQNAYNIVLGIIVYEL